MRKDLSTPTGRGRFLAAARNDNVKDSPLNTMNGVEETPRRLCLCVTIGLILVKSFCGRVASSMQERQHTHLHNRLIRGLGAYDEGTLGCIVFEMERRPT